MLYCLIKIHSFVLYSGIDLLISNFNLKLFVISLQNVYETYL